MNIISENIHKLNNLCKKHKVKSLYAIGSVLTSRFRDDSDIDLVVNFNDSEVEDSFVNFFDFQDALETLFARKVDLVDYSAINSNIFLSEVNRTRQFIYG